MVSITINPDDMPYTPPNIECLRFGGRIGGQGIGCCGIDIFQGFDNDPDAPAVVPLYNGDSPTNPVMYGKKQAKLGPTNLDVFLGYLRVGTFDNSEVPNRAFLASLTAYQAKGEIGKKWLKILYDNGFEFLRAIDNSVYSGSDLDKSMGSHPIYIFALFRNISAAAISDPFLPPAAWREIAEFTPAPDLVKLWRDNSINFYVPEEKTASEEPVKAASPFAHSTIF